MVRLRHLEGQMVNIQRLAVPETSGDEFVFDPREWLTYERWSMLCDGIIQYLRAEEYETACKTATALAAVFPERKQLIPFTLSDLNKTVLSLVKVKADPWNIRDEVYEAEKVVETLQLAKNLFPYQVIPELDRAVATIIKALPSYGNLLTAYSTAVGVSLATGRRLDTSNLDSNPHILRVAQTMEYEWWRYPDDSYDMVVSLMINKLLSPEHSVKIPARAKSALLSYVRIDQPSLARGCAANLLNLTVATAQSAEFSPQGLQITIGNGERADVQEQPPQQRNF